MPFLFSVHRTLRCSMHHHTSQFQGIAQILIGFRIAFTDRFPIDQRAENVVGSLCLATAHTGEGTVLCALDARRAQVYSAAFDLATHTRLLDDDARAVTDLADFVENCKKPLFFVGDGAGLCYNKYSNVPGVLQTPPALRGGRAAAVALVAKQMAAAGQAVLPEALLPDYHRLSQAERERAERLAAEAAANHKKAEL